MSLLNLGDLPRGSALRVGDLTESAAQWSEKRNGSGGGLGLGRRLDHGLPLVGALDFDAGRLAWGLAVQPLVCPDAAVAGPQAKDNCRATSSGRVLPSRDAVPAEAAAVFGDNWRLAVQSGRSALVGGHGRSSVGRF